jgi:enamine deaminase RidA (YjgF/YER057c/UK114 family)
MNTPADTPEARLLQLGIELPDPTVVPPGLHLPFTFVNRRGDRVLISGHPKNAADGSIAGPYGKLGAELATEEGYQAARDIGLSVLSNLRAELGSLDRITGWLRVFGMVNSVDGYSDQHLVINGFSDLIVDVFGAEVGRHARSAIGVAGLPMNFAIEIEAEVMIGP